MMDKRIKRPREDEECVVNLTQVCDGGFWRWTVDETVAYLRREGLEQWEQKFRGNIHYYSLSLINMILDPNNMTAFINMIRSRYCNSVISVTLVWSSSLCFTLHSYEQHSASISYEI